MKAILINEDKSLAFREVECPELRDGEIKIKVSCAAVNRADLLQREGSYPPPPGCPEWPGLEVSGEVCELSEKAARDGKWKIGDKVCALLGGGGYAEYVCVPQEMVMPIPRDFDDRGGGPSRSVRNCLSQSLYRRRSKSG